MGRVVRLSGDVAADGSTAATLQDAYGVGRLLRDFLSWEPIIPTDRNGKLDLKGFAELLAPLCRLLRDDVTDALKRPGLASCSACGQDWRQLALSLTPRTNSSPMSTLRPSPLLYCLARSESDD